MQWKLKRKIWVKLVLAIIFGRKKRKVYRIVWNSSDNFEAICCNNTKWIIYIWYIQFSALLHHTTPNDLQMYLRNGKERKDPIQSGVFIYKWNLPSITLIVWKTTAGRTAAKLVCQNNASLLHYWVSVHNTCMGNDFGRYIYQNI